MEIDPATICARTGAGEAELARPKSGLTLPQRKALSLLAAPRAYAEFAAVNRLDTERLGRDLARLAELGLVTLQLGSVVIAPPSRPRPDAAPVRAAPAAIPKPRPVPPPADEGLRPVVIGAAATRSPMRVVVLAAVVAVAAAAGWLALRDDSRAAPRAEARPAPAPQANATAPDATMSAATPPVAASESPAPAPSADVAAPAAQDARAVLPERAAVARQPAAVTNAAATRTAETRLAAAAPTMEPTSARSVGAAAPAQTAQSPVTERAAATPVQSQERVAEPATASPAAATAPTPVQVAAAARPSIVAPPSAKAALQPIVREAPEFPKEAINEGVTSGTVKARVTLDGSGKVTGIEILDAKPRRVFDRAVRAALWRWQYEPGAPDRTADVEVAFARQ